MMQIDPVLRYLFQASMHLYRRNRGWLLVWLRSTATRFEKAGWPRPEIELIITPCESAANQQRNFS
jgi:hypothetical protein